MLRRHNDKTDDIFLETDKDYYTVNIQGDIFHVEKTTLPKVTHIPFYLKEDEIFTTTPIISTHTGENAVGILVELV